MLYLQVPFVSRVGIYLENFVQKKQYLWNASCPICGDVSKGRKKKRFFIYLPPHASTLNVRCHHCQYSVSFENFLKFKFPELFKEYLFEKFKSKAGVINSSKRKLNDQSVVTKETKNKFVEPKLTKQILKQFIIPCTKLDFGHKAISYLRARCIPESKYKFFWYTPKFKEFVNYLSGEKHEIKDEHDRLIIPFFNEEGNKIIAFQARAFDEKRNPKYITVKFNESEKIFGLERVDLSKKIYVVEGPIDSLFLDNAIAVAGSHFDVPFVQKHKENVVLVFDNEPRNKEICKQIHKHILLGYNICLLPHAIKFKDINEMIIGGMMPQEIMSAINENTFSGAEALLRFSAWKQISF